MILDDLPAQPDESEWRFISDLQVPLWDKHPWTPQPPGTDEACLLNGACVDAGFPDSEHLLETAYADLRAFLAAGEIPADGPFTIETAEARTATREAYRIEVTPAACRILAADTEGIRRGLFHIEDMMLRGEGPFLPLGIVERKPFVQTRISRCFFGPIKRPPKCRDELMENTDYYPDNYLNRLAHEAINGLWLSVEFKDLCKTSITPEFGEHAETRFARLRRTVEKCRRYGIRIYLYANEPAMWDADSPILKRHPELGSLWPALGDTRLCCPFSVAAQQYLYEATNGIFAAVPHLGGLINITHGERYTTCLSAVTATDNNRPACPVCAEKAPWEIVTAVLHTWDQTLRHHVHLHCLIPGGALANDRTRWIPARKGFLFPVKPLSQVFRGKFIALLTKAFRAGRLHFPGKTAPLGTAKTFAQLVRKLRSKPWVVYAKASFPGPSHVLDYLGRYTHRVAIANHRITNVKAGAVSFTYRDRAHAGKKKTMTLPAAEFIRRFLLHVLPKGFMRIRHFGFLASRSKTRDLARCRELLGAAGDPEEAPRKTAPDLLLELTGTDLHVCPRCRQRAMRVVAELSPLYPLCQATPSRPPETWDSS